MSEFLFLITIETYNIFMITLLCLCMYLFKILHSQPLVSIIDTAQLGMHVIILLQPNISQQEM